MDDERRSIGAFLAMPHMKCIQHDRDMSNQHNSRSDNVNYARKSLGTFLSLWMAGTSDRAAVSDSQAQRLGRRCDRDDVTSRVAYFYDDEIGRFIYAPHHPMKPHRVRVAHQLICGYGLTETMHCFLPRLATRDDMTRFHSNTYIDFLEMATPETAAQMPSLWDKYGIGEDCPVFNGLFEFCQISAGGSISGASALNTGNFDIAINWAGDLQHAKDARSFRVLLRCGLCPWDLGASQALRPSDVY
jgi:hypothetical protein